MTINAETKSLQPLYWGLLHGVNDMLAGFLLATYTLSQDYKSSFLYISLYAILAFGGAGAGWFLA